MRSGEILMAGIPHAGKTSYLALVYLAIMKGRSATITLGGYSDDREYLNDLVGRLFRCEVAKHTETGRTDGLSLSVDLPNGDAALLVIPDLSGETWLEALVDRTWTAELRDRVAETTGACVFVNVADFVDDPPIAQADRADEAAGVAPADRETDSGAEGKGQSAQVQLVDLIQVLAENASRSPRRISLVLSAFDLVAGMTPDEWMRMSAPLLVQYLEANTSWLQVEVFGLSAQGGRFEVEEERAELLERDPLERASIVTAKGQATDYDEPVLWVMALA